MYKQLQAANQLLQKEYPAQMKFLLLETTLLPSVVLVWALGTLWRRSRSRQAVVWQAVDRQAQL